MALGAISIPRRTVGSSTLFFAGLASPGCFRNQEFVETEACVYHRKCLVLDRLISILLFVSCVSALYWKMSIKRACFLLKFPPSCATNECTQLCLYGICSKICFHCTTFMLLKTPHHAESSTSRIDVHSYCSARVPWAPLAVKAVAVGQLVFVSTRSPRV